MTEQDIKAELDAAKLRALELLERWAERNVGYNWRVSFVTASGAPRPWRIGLYFSNGVLVQAFHGSTQHDCMAQAATYVAGIL